MGKTLYFANCQGRYWTVGGQERWEAHAWSKKCSSAEKAQEAANDHASNNEGHRTSTQEIEEEDDGKLSSNEPESSGSEEVITEASEETA